MLYITRFLMLLCCIVLMPACNLGVDSATSIPVELDTATAPAIASSTDTPLPNTATQQPPTVTVAQCKPNADWPTYTVRSGDTLSALAQLAITDLNTLIVANCLEDASTIYAGQVLYVPRSIVLPATQPATMIATPPPVIEIFLFEITPLVVSHDSPITVRWDVQHAGKVSIREIHKDGRYGQWYSDLALSGEITLNTPDNANMTSITYQLVAETDDGRSETKQITVELNSSD